MPEFEVAIPRPQRWDEPFDHAMTDHEVDRLLAVDPFRAVDPDAFPPTLSLRGILRNDTRLSHYQHGDLIVREGDYGHSAFLILRGTVHVAVQSLDPSMLGRSEPPRPTWRRSLAQLWNNAKLPEVRREKPSAGGSSDQVGTRLEDRTTRIFLQDVPRLVDHLGTVRLGPGELFGELAALARTPRTATVFAEGAVTLLEIRWQGLRDLMRRTPQVRRHVETLYRANSLRVHLRETPLLSELSDEALCSIAAATEFQSYGNFDWYSDFGQQRQLSPAERIAAEPLIATQDQVPDGLWLVRSGFARVSRRHGHGQQTVAYLGKGQVFGWTELLESHQSGQPTPLRHSLRAVGYVDVLRIPADVIWQIVLPALPPAKLADWCESCPSFPTQATTDRSLANTTSIDSHTLDFLADHRFLNGTETMLINLDRCTRCDDCVRACAATHDNNPRFVRQGPKHDSLMVAAACMHCVDPVCMIGCPTGAIARDSATGVVRINDRTCIGCATCANSCPYQAIRMVEVRDAAGAFWTDEATGQPIVKATKCDLCADQITGPACQNACPHDALVRIDMSDLQSVGQWLNR